MLKKIIIYSALIFITGISSCSMWDDVDKNAPFIIPVASINVDSGLYIDIGGSPNPSQWNDIPVLFNTFTGSGTLDKDITEIKIATNSEKNRIFIKILTSSIINLSANVTSYMIILSKDINCEGRKFLIYYNSYGIYNLCDSIDMSPTVICSSSFYTTNRAGLAPSLEILIDVNSIGIDLSNGFMISVYSSNFSMPYLPIKSSPFRWVKFPE